MGLNLNYISIRKGLSQCEVNGAHLTSAALESGEYIHYIPDKGFYLGEEFIAKTLIAALTYLQNQAWAMNAKWYIEK